MSLVEILKKGVVAAAVTMGIASPAFADAVSATPQEIQKCVLDQALDNNHGNLIIEPGEGYRGIGYENNLLVTMAQEAQWGMQSNMETETMSITKMHGQHEGSVMVAFSNSRDSDLSETSYVIINPRGQTIDLEGNPVKSLVNAMSGNEDGSQKGLRNAGVGCLGLSRRDI